MTTVSASSPIWEVVFCEDNNKDRTQLFIAHDFPALLNMINQQGQKKIVFVKKRPEDATYHFER